MKNKILVLASLAFSIMIITSCGKKGSDTSSATENTGLVYPAMLVKEGKVSSTLTLPGELEGFFETGIVAKVNGYIKNMHVDIGDRVHTGELLVELEAPELLSELATANSEYQAKEALYNNSKAKYIRFKQTNETPGAVSPYDMDLAKTNLISDSLIYLATKTKYEAIRELTAYLRITAPFDGIITARDMAPGAFVGPEAKQGKPILRLKSENKLRLHIAIPEKYLAEVSEGDMVDFQVKSFPNQTFKGKITRLSKSLNVMTRSEIVEIEIDNRKGELLPGMYAIAAMPIKRPGKSIVVPQTAVVTNMERQFVIKITDGNKVSYVDIEKGEEQKDQVEIFGDLNPGDTILTKASDEIKQKSVVKVSLVDKK